MDWLLLWLASRMICWQQATPVVQMESLEVPPAVARPDLSACDNKNNGKLKRSFFFDQNSTSLRISWVWRG